MLLVNPIGQYININTHSWHDDQTLFARIRAYRWYLVVVASTGGLVVLVSLFSSASNLLFAVSSLFLMVWAGSWNSTLVPLLNMLGDRRDSILWSIVTVLSGIGFSTFFVVIDASASNWLFGQAIGFAIGAFGARYSLRKFESSTNPIQKVSLISRKNILTYCFPLVAATGLMWLSQSGYRFIIEHFWGLSALAFFAVGLQVASAIWVIIETIAMQFLYPYFFRAVSHGSNEVLIQQSYSDLLNLLAPIYILVAAFFIVGTPYLMVLLVDDKYNSALDFLVLGVVIEFCRVVANIFSNAAHVRRKTSSLALPYSIAALLVILGVSFVGSLGYPIIYAAYMLVFASVGMLLAMAILMNRQISYNLDKKRWFVAILIFVVVVFSGLFMPEDLSFAHSFLALILLALPAIVLLIGFLIKNAALKRLMSHKLVRADT